MVTTKDVIVIGSGIGGLVAGAMLAYYDKKVVICESHSIPGGAAHSFSRQGFHFDSGPSFYCGLADPNSLNPLQKVFNILGESIETCVYDPLGHYHFPEGSLPVYAGGTSYLEAVAKFTTQGAKELKLFQDNLLQLYAGLKGIPPIVLRADFWLIPILLGKYGLSLLKMLPSLGEIGGSVGQIMDKWVKDPWVRRLIDLECFLLSGLKANGTVAPEVAFMFGERSNSVIEYPIGGSSAIVNALVRGLERWGGQLRLNAHVEQILIESGQVVGVRLRGDEVIKAPIVISNATIWDTYAQLLRPEDLPTSLHKEALGTPAVESFMHLHLGIRSDGLEGLTGHHVVVLNGDIDISVPGNTCMISIPSVWDPTLAPSGHHVIHAYTLESFSGWQKDESYSQRKREKAESLFLALERIIPDIRQRITLELIGTPLTHARFLRRYQGTYGPAIVAGKGSFPGPQTPIPGLYRVGDSTMPGIGVPAVAASGVICANTLASLNYLKLLRQL
ncbi:MAG: NAD(P)/FAD-dependent oxidoreductase [Trichodesmium sp. MAG_R01]|nr:NAD(P)/FAD-dependent oxidoreductase [Trichodesmium sp. MAG_R01]